MLDFPNHCEKDHFMEDGRYLQLLCYLPLMINSAFFVEFWTRSARHKEQSSAISISLLQLKRFRMISKICLKRHAHCEPRLIA